MSLSQSLLEISNFCCSHKLHIYIFYSINPRKRPIICMVTKNDKNDHHSLDGSTFIFIKVMRYFLFGISSIVKTSHAHTCCLQNLNLP